MSRRKRPTAAAPFMKQVASGLLFVSLLAGCGYVNLRGVGPGESVAGSGNRRTERREVAGFDRLVVEGAFRVEAACGAGPSVEIEADDNLLPLIRTPVEGGRLRVHSERGLSMKALPVLRLTAPDLREIELPGASDFTLTGVRNESLTINVPGASKLRAQGETGRLEVNLSGAGLVDAEGLRARHVAASCSGAGSISVHASEALDASVSGVGSINYAGDPATVNRNVSGLGRINKK